VTHNVLYAWDMGTANGHLARFLSLNPALAQQGLNVYAAVNRVRVYGQRLKAAGIPVLQSPVSVPPQGAQLKSLSLGHIFHNRGYADVPDLLGMVEGWRSLMQLTAARLVLVDAAPAALIAARTLALPVANLSNTFHTPPPIHPFAYFPNVAPDDNALQQIEERLNTTLHAVMAYYEVPAPARFADLFAVAQPGFFCFQEFDPYLKLRKPEQIYHGPLTNEHRGKPFVWPQSADKGLPRIFAYLQPNTPPTLVALQALAQLGWPTVVCCPGFSQVPALQQLSLKTPSLSLHDELLDIQQVKAEADAALNYGSCGVVQDLILGGLPLLLMPYDSEKILFSRVIQKLGYGINFSPQLGVDGCCNALRTLLNDPAPRQTARAFASRHASYSAKQTATVFAQHCRSLVDAAAPFSY